MGALMFPREIARQVFLLSVVCICTSFGQQKTPAPAASQAQEFPVVMQQSVSAGKTAVGTKVQAKLEIATWLEGKVVPRNASLTGEVIESAAKTSTSPSRLAIRMDSAQWKDGSAALKIYLTAWYYPAIQQAGQDLQYEPPQSPGKTWNGQGAYPSHSPSYKPFPTANADDDKKTVPDTATTKISDHRVVMKDVEWMRAEDGTVALISKRGNIKLDKLTTYVFAASGAVPAK